MHNIYISGVSQDRAYIQGIKDIVEHHLDNVNCQVGVVSDPNVSSNFLLEFEGPSPTDYEVAIFVTSKASREEGWVLRELKFFLKMAIPVYACVVDELDFESTSRCRYFKGYGPYDNRDALIAFVCQHLRQKEGFDVFISYSRKDFEKASALKQRLEENLPGIRCWFDVDGIESGDKFEDKIVSAIEHSKILLFAISENSMQSEFAQHEVIFAHNLGKRIVPVILDGSRLSGWFLFRFGNVNYTDFSDADQFNRLLADFKRWLDLDVMDNSEDMISEVAILEDEEQKRCEEEMRRRAEEERRCEEARKREEAACKAAKDAMPVGVPSEQLVMDGNGSAPDDVFLMDENANASSLGACEEVYAINEDSKYDGWNGDYADEDVCLTYSEEEYTVIPGISPENDRSKRLREGNRINLEKLPSPIPNPCSPQRSPVQRRSEENGFSRHEDTVSGNLNRSGNGFLSNCISGIRRLFGKSESIVNTCVYAPSQASVGSDIIVQVFLHLPSEVAEVETMAKAVDASSHKRNAKKLSFPLKNGEVVDVVLDIPAISISHVRKSLAWRGCCESVEFAVSIPRDCQHESLLSTVLLLKQHIPVAEMSFNIELVSHPSKASAEIFGYIFRRAFISYSHKDFATVEPIANLLKKNGIEYFFDKHTLRAGDKFRDKIREWLELSDLFILCWSKNSEQSKEVKTEIDMALDIAGRKGSTLRICPFLFAPKAPIPPEMIDIYNFTEL